MKPKRLIPKQWWRMLLMLLVFLLAGSSPTWAKCWHFYSSSEHAVVNNPTKAKPYLEFNAMYYDGTDSDNGYFVSSKPTSSVYKDSIPSDAKAGPAIFINGHYLCSPVGEFAWNDNESGADRACSTDGWWGAPTQER